METGTTPQDFPQFHHVSTGDLLRAHVRDGTDLGSEAARYMKEGKLVPDELMIGLVTEEATPHIKQGLSLLLDGFPRTVAQAESLGKTVPVNMVINLDIPTETIVARLADRYGSCFFFVCILFCIFGCSVREIYFWLCCCL